MAIKLFDVTWTTNTAGPSPFDNNRTEVFFKGCDRAMAGNPCPGCFNTPLWSFDTDKVHEPQDVANQIIAHAPNKFVTIGGGEPTAQLDDLITLVTLLKGAGFHIMMYSWQTLPDMLTSINREKYEQLFSQVDMLVDGPYMQEERCYDDMNRGDGFLNSVGSGNQVIWDLRNTSLKQKTRYSGYHVRDVVKLELSHDMNLSYFVRRDAVKNLISYDKI